MRYTTIMALLAGLVIGRLAGASAVVAQEREAEVALQRAMHVEQVQGDLQQAIGLYLRILKEHRESRAVAARAQLHVGFCYEKLGLTQARQAYRTVINDFPEQRDEVASARERLASLTQEVAELRRRPTFRKVAIASKPQEGVLSPDGSKLAFVSDGGVWVVPLRGNVDPHIAGEPVRLADVPHVWDSGSLMAWSGDGKWIAVNSWLGDEGVPVYLVPASGGEPRRLTMPPRGGHPWNYRVSLSPDGRTLAFAALELGAREDMREYHDRRIYTMPTTGDEPTTVASVWGALPSFSPDGKHIAFVGYREREDSRRNTERERYDGDLWIASATSANAVRVAAVDGRLRGPIWSPDGKYIAAHYEPGTDNSSNEIWVFPVLADRSSAGQPTKIALGRDSWDMLAGWTPDGALGVFMQSESHQAVYTVPASGGNAVQVTPEQPWIWYPRWSADGSRIYVRTVQDQPPHVRVEYVPAGGGDLVTVPLHTERWLFSRVPGGGLNVSPDGGRLVLSGAQEPFDPKEGVDLWTIPVEGGRPTRLTSDASLEGYPCWSPDGRWIAFTDSRTNPGSTHEQFVGIYVVPANGGEVRELTVEADSVAYGPIAYSPDGERVAFFSNRAIKTIPSSGGQRPEVLVSDVRYSAQSDLMWSPDGTKIAYSGAGKIWIASVSGGAPEELRTGLPGGTQYGTFSWSPNGEKIAFMGSSGGDAEFWLIGDFLPQER